MRIILHRSRNSLVTHNVIPSRTITHISHIHSKQQKSHNHYAGVFNPTSITKFHSTQVTVHKHEILGREMFSSTVNRQQLRKHNKGKRLQRMQERSKCGTDLAGNTQQIHHTTSTEYRQLPVVCLPIPYCKSMRQAPTSLLAQTPPYLPAIGATSRNYSTIG